jgi:hypothetical protein
MTLPDHLAELAVAIETSTTREEAWIAVELFLETATAKQGLLMTVISHSMKSAD